MSTSSVDSPRTDSDISSPIDPVTAPTAAFGATGVPFDDAQARGLVADVRAHFDSGLTRPLAWRYAQLDGLDAMLREHRDRWADALQADLGKHPTEAFLTETGYLLGEIAHIRSKLKGWLRPKRVSVPPTVAPARAHIVREPLGVVLIIAPWNYPLTLSISPLIGAIAAGNAAVVKPSELAPATSALLAKLLPSYVDPSAITVVEGAVEETTALLNQRFDHIFYTGNGTVGRVVMEAAAKHLTPVTLELGGKSPTFIDGTGDLAAAARRIVWAKLINSGQTCIAPDYVLATPGVAAELEVQLESAITAAYGDDPMRSPDLGSIVNQRHFDRLIALMADADIAVGGQCDPDELKIEPTVLRGVRGDDAVMGQEIFGPILPIIEVADVDEAIRFVQGRDRPLALYVFSEDRSVRRRWTEETSSGALCFNVALAHVTVPGLPFGGVGASGMGAYHGEYSIATFSHAKSVLSKPFWLDSIRMVSPPYDRRIAKFAAKAVARLS